MTVFDHLRHLESYLFEEKHGKKMAELYEWVQYAGNILPRLYVFPCVSHFLFYYSRINLINIHTPHHHILKSQYIYFLFLKHKHFAFLINYFLGSFLSTHTSFSSSSILFLPLI